MMDYKTEFEPLRALSVCLDDALLFVPWLANNDSLRNWLLRHPHIRRQHGRVVLPDLLKEVDARG